MCLPFSRVGAARVGSGSSRPRIEVARPSRRVFCSVGACSSHRIALTGFRLGHLSFRCSSRSREAGSAARHRLPTYLEAPPRAKFLVPPPSRLDGSRESLGPTLVVGHFQEPFPEDLHLGLAPCGGGRNHAAAATDLPVELEHGDQRSFSQFRCDHRRASDGRAHALQAGRMDRTLHRQELNARPSRAAGSSVEDQPARPIGGPSQMLEQMQGNGAASTTWLTWRSRSSGADPVAGSEGGSVTNPPCLARESPALGGPAIRR